MKRRIVSLLERACGMVHDRGPLMLFLWLPLPWGEGCRLAQWSAYLDAHWNTGVWTKKA